MANQGIKGINDQSERQNSAPEALFSTSNSGSEQVILPPSSSVPVQINSVMRFHVDEINYGILVFKPLWKYVKSIKQNEFKKFIDSRKVGVYRCKQELIKPSKQNEEFVKLFLIPFKQDGLNNLIKWFNDCTGDLSNVKLVLPFGLKQVPFDVIYKDVQNITWNIKQCEIDFSNLIQ